MGQRSPPLLLPRGIPAPSGSGVSGFPFLLYSSGAPVTAGPTCLAGLRYYHDAVQELCLVAEADAPSGMGGVWKVHKNGVNYAVYLVETTDPDASPVRIQTTAGIKAARFKT